MDQCPENQSLDRVPCAELLNDDLGWGLGTIFRSYVTSANAQGAEIPGGPRGYQVLTAAVVGNVTSQLALAQRLGIDRTVMTYLLDDLETAHLIERQPDPSDRRARRIVATPQGTKRLSELNESLRSIEERLLAPLEPAARTQFRSMVQAIAARIDDAEVLFDPCNEETAQKI
jgi:DNA-binding MarR family transcriptional regulator